MPKIVVIGKKKLCGKIRISGAKNSALPILAAALLTKNSVLLHNIPKLGDVSVMSELLRSLGVKLNFSDNIIEMKADLLKLDNLENNPLLTRIRYSVHLIGALLPQFKEVTIPLPGGCVIGTRKLDSHLLGFKSMGAKVVFKNGFIKVSAEQLHGCNVKLEYPSVGATENLLIAASLAEGNSVIENVAREPEIVDLANFLNSMGAKIAGAGSGCIRVRGVDELGGTDYSIIPDRIETGTYIVATAVTNGDVILENTNPNHLKAVVTKIQETGVDIEEDDGDLHVRSLGKFDSVDFVTATYPGFPTDMQPIITPLLATAVGRSSIRETIYDNRFTHIPELLKMGADINLEGDVIRVSGVKELVGAKIKANDIRCGGALILAGLCAKGKTIITGIDQILRGYENPVVKLRNVGAEISLC